MKTEKKVPVYFTNLKLPDSRPWSDFSPLPLPLLIAIPPRS